MSMRDLIIDIQDEIALGALSFAEIARKYEVPLSWVNDAWVMLGGSLAEPDAVYHDELERDQDEAYEPDLCDSWYEDQYDLGDY